jgi:hypothetical protein
MDPAFSVLVIVNLLAAFGGAVALALYLRNATRFSGGLMRYFLHLIVLYFIECFGLGVWRGIPVFSVIFAFIWGLVLGRWLRSFASHRQALKTAFYISLYSSFPVASLLLIPLVCLLAGWNIVDVSEAIRMGIPEFVPAPVNTILGFFGFLALCGVILKMVVTTGIASILILLRH